MKIVLQIPKAQELLLLLDQATFNTLVPLEYSGIPFLFFWCETLSQSDGKSPASYYHSTLTGGFDVYVYEGVSKEESRRLLFHELLEAYLRSCGVSNREAHQLALQEEEKVFGSREKMAA